MTDNPKKYLVQVDSYDPKIIDADAFEKKRDDFFQKFPQANVTEISSFEDDGEVGDSDSLLIQVDGYDAKVIDADTYRRKSADFRKAYPDAMISRVKPVDYWGDRLRETDSAIAPLEKRLGEIDEELSSPDIRVGGFRRADAVRLANEKSNIGKQLEGLYADRDNNYLYRKQREAQAKMFEDEDTKLSEMQKQLSDENPDAEKARRASLVGGGAGPHAASAQVFYKKDSDPEFNRDAESLALARIYIDEAKKTAFAPSKGDKSNGFANFFRGLQGAAPESISVVNLIKTGLDMHLVDAIKKIQETDGEDANIFDLVESPDKLTYLSSSEKELVKAFCIKSAVDAERAGDLSIGYQAGDSAMRSLGFMADFLMFGGEGSLANAAGKKATEGLLKATARASNRLALKGMARKAALAPAKFGIGTLEAAVKTAVMTPMMPSSWTNLTDNLLSVNDAGQVDLSGKAILNAIGDTFIENLSENAGEQVEAIIDAPFKLAGKAMSKVIPETKFTDWAKIFRNSGASRLMRDAAWHGYFGEIGEEWYGNALRVMTGVDKDALKNFATVDQQLITLISFAPMSVFGMGTSAGQYLSARKGMNKSAERLSALLSQNGYDEAQIRDILDVTKAENPTQLAAKLSPVITQLAEDNATEDSGAQIYRAVCDYAQAVARYRVFDGIHDADVSDQRNAMANELSDRAGLTSIAQTHDAGNGVTYETVRTLTDPDVGPAYVVGEQDGKLALVQADNGRKYFIPKEQIGENVIDSGEMPLNDFLDREIARKRSASEAERIETDRKQQAQEIFSALNMGDSINVGTEEDPAMGIVIAKQPDGRTVIQLPDGSVNEYTPSEIGNLIGKPISSKTDEQIETEAADAEQEVEDAVRWFRDARYSGEAQGLPFVMADGSTVVINDVRRGESTGSVTATITTSDGQETTAELPAKSVNEAILGSSVVTDGAETKDDSTPRDFRGNPLPLKEDGNIDQTALWNNDPEAWAMWNDSIRNDGGENSLAYIETAAGKLKKDIKNIDKEYAKTTDFDKRDSLEGTRKNLQDRLAALDAVRARYAERQSAEAAAKMQAGIERAREARKAKADELAKYNTESLEGINKKWEDAPKDIGTDDVIVLPNGEEIGGNYVLTEAFAPTPSHDTEKGYAKTEGFPVDENGQTVNDRDYEHDREAQRQVEQKAAAYDQRALQTPVVVSSDGVVLSGNDRTMASQLAARQGTDTKYNEYLAKHPQKYGFTAEQVAKYSNPRVVFVPTESMPYTASTFAKFNAEEKKTQSKTESAVKAGKTITPETVATIAQIIDAHESIAETYADEKAVAAIIRVLVDAGAVQENEISRLMDGNLLSGTGEDLVESVLLGAVMREDALRCAMGDKAIRRSIMSALTQLLKNNTYGEYSLSGEFSDAVVLLYQAKHSGLVKGGESITNFMNQPVLEGFGENPLAAASVQMIANTINGTKVNGLKNVLSLYNAKAEMAASGQADLFLGDVETKEQIIREILNEYGYNTETFAGEQQQSTAAAAEQPEQSEQSEQSEQGSSEEQAPDAVSGDAGSGEEEIVGHTLLDAVKVLYSKGKEYASKIFQRSFFDVAKTPKFMRELGLNGEKFTIKYGVISRHLSKDGSHAITEQEWEQLPEALQHPFAISKLSDRAKGYRIYTTIQTENGEYIVVGVDVKNAGRDIEVNSIVTVFGRRENANLPSNEEVIYRSNEITPEQSSLLGQPNSDQYPTERESSETTLLDGDLNEPAPDTSETTPSLRISDGKSTQSSETKQENAEISEGRSIQGLEGYSRKQIKGIVSDHIRETLSDAGINAEIVGVEIHGSRNRGNAREDSDLDIVVEYRGDIREDDMFNTLNDAENQLVIEGIKVDINPIRAEETGTLLDYMKRSKAYDQNKAEEDFREYTKTRAKEMGFDERIDEVVSPEEDYTGEIHGWGKNQNIQAVRAKDGRVFYRVFVRERKDGHFAKEELLEEAGYYDNPSYRTSDMPKNIEFDTYDEAEAFDKQVAAGKFQRKNVDKKTDEETNLFAEAQRIDNERQAEKSKKGNESVKSKTKKETPEKIEDYGEQIAGARKDMLRDLAKSVQNASLESLISLPFGKAFKKPNLRKAVETGALRESDAQFAQSIIAAFLSTKKPVAGTKDERRKQRWGQKTDVQKWAEKAYTGVKILQELFNADEETRDRVMQAALAEKYVGIEEAKAEQKRISELNSGREFNGTSYPLNLIALYNEVFNRLGYPAGQETKIPVGKVAYSSTFDSYSLRGANGKDWLMASRDLKTFEDVVDEMVYLIKVANADETADHPVNRFKRKGINVKTRVSGYRVLAAKKISLLQANRFAVDEIFPTEEEALKRIEELKSQGMQCLTPIAQKERIGYEKYEIVFENPLTNEYIPLGKEYETAEEADAAPDAEHDELNRLANEAIAAESKKHGDTAEKSYFHIISYYEKGEDGKYHWYYGIALDDKYGPKKTAFNTMPFFLAEHLNSHAEAQKMIDENKTKWEGLVKNIVRQRSNFVYFSGENASRQGEDYRKGKDVTAEEFAKQFGFRGVQFGNWANQADRQAALNNAYDSFMDMAKIIGVSPRAMSLDGELGIAFGSRGSGAANAHYEPGEVVINLTKTRGAGALAHEWWHALDNYFSRSANVKMGYVTSDKRLPMREEMREAFNRLVDDVEKSDYHSRSTDRGASYWGTREEETARLFEVWIADEMIKRGERNAFLAGRNDAEDSYAQMGYAFYKAVRLMTPGEKVMSFDEFKKTPMALKGFVYPTREELETLGKDVRDIFGVVEERTNEETGDIALFQMIDKALSNDTPEKQLAFDTVSQMLSDAGIPVEHLSDDAMRQMAEASQDKGEAELLAHSNSPKARWLNNYVEAVHLVTGEDKKSIRKKITERIAEARREAKELYANVLSGNFNSLTLRQINNYIDNATNKNRFLRPLSQRLPERALAAVSEGGRTSAVDALFSRICESTVPANGRTRAEARRAIETRKEELLEGWAKATGNWHESIADFTGNTAPIKSGTDSDVYLSDDGGSVIKASKGKFDNRKFPSDIDQVNLFNAVFPHSAYRILGYGRLNGKFVRFIEQQFVDFSTSQPLTTEERVEYMRRLGFEPRNEEKTVFSNGEIVVSDLQKSNIVKDTEGNIRVIDADVKLHTKDIGGNYTYPPVETDTEVPEFMTVYHGSGAKFDRFDHSHMGEGEGEQAFGWGTYVTEVEGIGKSYAKNISQSKLNFKHALSARFITSLKRYMGEGLSFQKAKQNLIEVVSNALKEQLTSKNSYYSQFQHDFQMLKDMTEEDMPKEILYTVDIPENRGNNYLDWNKKINETETDILTEIDNKLYNEEGWHRVESGDLTRFTKGKETIVLNPNATGADIYEELSVGLGSPKTASEFLNSLGYIGISYPAEYMSGGRGDGARNYVIFDEDNAKITDRIEFLKNGDTVYGAAVGGKIFLNADRLNPNTPIHEYTHLWDKACKARNPELWKRGVELMKQTSLWKEVENDPNYAGLDEDGIAGEVHARLSGEHGAETLERLSKEAIDENGNLAESAMKASVIGRLRKWLSEFWHWVKDTMTPWSREEAEKVSIEDFINMPLADLAKGTKLNDNQYNAEERNIIDNAKKDGTFMKAPNGNPTNLNERQWVQVRTEAFKEWFGDWENDPENASKAVDENGEPKVLYHGGPYRFFRFDPARLGQSTDANSAREGFFFTDSQDLADVFAENSLKTLPEDDLDSLVEARINEMTGDELEDAYIAYRNEDDSYQDYIDETESPSDEDFLKGYDYDYGEGYKDGMSLDDARRAFLWNAIATKLYGGYFSGIEDIAEELSTVGVNLGNTEAVFLNLRTPAVDEVERDYFHEGEDISPMTPTLKEAKENGRDGAIFTGITENGQEGPAFQYVVFNPNQIKSAVENSGKFSADNDDIRFSIVTDKDEIDRLNSKPTIKVYRAMQLVNGKLYPPMSGKVNGKWRDGIAVEDLGKVWEKADENPELADDKGRFTLNKGNGTTLKARYNPYIHTSTTPLNDQFSSAQSRPELVTVEVEIPKSELTSGYKADKAKDSVGKVEWKAGVVQGKLSGTRTVILSRWDKPVRIVPESEVADKIVEMFDGKDITMPSNVVTPALRAELERRGVPFVETDNQGKQIRFRNGEASFTPEQIARMETPILESKGTFKNLNEAEKWAKENLQGKSYTNTFTGENVYIGSKSLSEVFDKKFVKAISPDLHKAAVMSIPDFIKSGIPAEIHPDTHGRGFDVIRLYSAIIIDSNIYRVKSTVRRVPQGDRYYSYELQEMELTERRPLTGVGEEIISHNPNNSESPISELAGERRANREAEERSSVAPNGPVESIHIKSTDGTQSPTIGLDSNSRPQTRAISGEELLRGVKKTNSDEEILWNRFASDSALSAQGGSIVQSNALSSRAKVGNESEKTNESPENQQDIELDREGERSYDSVPTSLNHSESGKRYAAEETASAIGVKVEYISRDEMPKGHENAKGMWKDGKIYIALENHPDANDVRRTVLHEAVGHEGLRRLVGERNMNGFCMDVYKALPASERRKIADAALQRYGGDIYEATEEYLAELAEDMDTNKSYDTIWDEIRVKTRNLLSKIGINIPLSRRDIRWILWQSYNANRQGDLINEAQRQVLADRLGFSLRADNLRAKAQEEIRLRSANGGNISAANLYNNAVARASKRLHESWVEMTNSVSTLVEAIEKQTGKAAKSFEDIRLALNQQSSKELAAIKAWERDFYNPMMSAIKEMMDAHRLKREEIDRYAFLKHGLERNDVFAKRDAKAYYQSRFEKNVKKINGDERLSELEKKLKIADAEQVRDSYFADIDAGTDKMYLKFREKDYGGLTALFSTFSPISPQGENETDEEYNARVLASRKPQFATLAETEDAARAEVDAFEKRVGKASITKLWDATNKATKSILKHQYESNMISREQYTHVKDMFKYYVPMRGFADNTAADMYSYYASDKGSITPPLLRAKGRKTQAESPWGYIGAMASTAYAADFKNETKLALFYFISNRPDNDLVRISDVWYEKTSETDPDTGKPVFKQVYPEFKDGLNAAATRQEYDRWEADMEEKRKKGEAYKGTNGIDLQNSVIHIDDAQKNSHIIRFKVRGQEKMLLINGNPRAAQAINNELNIDAAQDGITKGAQKILRWMAGFNTSYNPEFWMSNAQRDLLFSIMATSIKESPEYTKQFIANLGRAVRVIGMIRKDKQGKLGSSYIEKMYKEFVDGGAVTGFTVIKDNEEWEQVGRQFTADRNKAGQAAMQALEAIQDFGEGIEQMTRFAAFLTARENGKSITEAVADAKELTVNFNRKGSGKGISWKESEKLKNRNGEKLNTAERVFYVGASMLSGYGRRFIMFFNASVQGLNTMYQLWTKDKRRTSAWMAGYFALGAINAMLHALLDDDDDYLDMPDYERRNNLLLGGKGNYFKWALPQESRVFYAMGDILVNDMILGRNPQKKTRGVGDILEAVGDIMPINPMNGLRGVVPQTLVPAFENLQNEDYKGTKVYNEPRWLSEEEQKRTPKYTMAYSNTGRQFVLLSMGLNYISGGDSTDAGAIDIRPEKMEHLFEGLTGGLGTTLNRFWKSTGGLVIDSAIDANESGMNFGDAIRENASVRNTPFLNRLWVHNDDRYRNAHTSDVFNYYKAEAEHTQNLIRKAKKEGDADLLDRLYDDDKRMNILYIYRGYSGVMKAYDRMLKITDDKAERRQLIQEQDEYRKEMIQEIAEENK